MKTKRAIKTRQRSKPQSYHSLVSVKMPKMQIMEMKRMMMKLSRKRRRRARPVQHFSLLRVAVEVIKTIYSSKIKFSHLSRIVAAKLIFSNLLPMADNQISVF